MTVALACALFAHVRPHRHREGPPAHRGAERIFDVVFLLVVVFTIVQGPTPPSVARLLGVRDDEATTDVTIESAPLEDIDVTVLQFTVPRESRLAGVYVNELRLPGDAVVTLIQRGGELVAPAPSTALRAGDQLLLAASNRVRAATERRLGAVSRGGRLADWNPPSRPGRR